MRRINRLSQFFQPTHLPQKNEVRKAEVPKSFQLMVDCGVISHFDSGMYAILPLGLRSVQKLINIVDEELSVVGGQKISLPSLTPTSLWKKTNRLEGNRSELFILKDRQDKEYVLNPTFEETITYIMAKCGALAKSHLPLRLHQTSSKWRDEMKPRLGFLRSREFLMNDLYSFDENSEKANESYQEISKTYERIFKLIGIPYLKTVGDTDFIGGSLSHEYFYKSDIGESVIKICEKCNSSTCGHQLDEIHTVEIGHTFLLGSTYSKPLNATFQDSNNKKQFLEMGCYGIGITRLITTAIEILSNEREIRWPINLAPYTVCIIPPKAGSREEAMSELVCDLYYRLHNRNIDAIVDDRNDHTIGKRMMEARRTGYPFVVVVGKHSAKLSSPVEVHNVYEDSSHSVDLKDVAEFIRFSTTE